MDNAQVGVFLSYASPRGHVLLDRRLYLPREWAEDPERREAAKVPKDVVFETKPQQALAMLQHAWALGVPMKWVTGDEIYGDSPEFRAGVEASGHFYVLAVACTTPVWKHRPRLEEPTAQTGGRPRRKVRVAQGGPTWKTVAQVAARWPASRWQRLSVGAGEKGPREYEWARGHVIERRDGLPGGKLWLLARRSLSDPQEIAYYLCLAPPEASLRQLAEVAGARFTIEQCFEEAKGEAGLDQYEVRFWQSWYRHITLALIALAWLVSLRALPEEKKRSAPGRAECGRSAPAAGGGAAAAGGLAGV